MKNNMHLFDIKAFHTSLRIDQHESDDGHSHDVLDESPNDERLGSPGMEYLMEEQ